MGAHISKVHSQKDSQRNRTGRKALKTPPPNISAVSFSHYSKTYNDKDIMFSDSAISPIDNHSINSTNLKALSPGISAKLSWRPRWNNHQKSTIGSPNTDMDRTSLSSFKSDDSTRAHSVASAPSVEVADSNFDASDNFVFNRNDEQEYNRQLRQHYTMKQVLGGNLQIALDTPPKMILHSACGAGFWAIEMAQTYPESKIIAMDVTLPLESTQTPRTQPTAPNVTFAYGNIMSPPLPFGDATFDLIYQREVGIIVPLDYWAPLLDDFARVLKPNGVLHLVEYDLGFPKCGPLSRIVNKAIDELLETAGYDRYFTETFESTLIESGFTDIRIQSFQIPIGEWPENNVELQQGFLVKDLLKGLLKWLKPRLCPFLQIFMEDYEQFCTSMLDEIEVNRSIHEWKVITARKM